VFVPYECLNCVANCLNRQFGTFNTAIPRTKTNSDEVNTSIPHTKTNSDEVNTLIPHTKTNSDEVNTLVPHTKTNSDEVNTLIPHTKTNSDEVNTLIPHTKTNSDAVNVYSTLSRERLTFMLLTLALHIYVPTYRVSVKRLEQTYSFNGFYPF
jgi:ABC-type transporter Mla subunit MlaD